MSYMYTPLPWQWTGYQQGILWIYVRLSDWLTDIRRIHGYTHKKLIGRPIAMDNGYEKLHWLLHRALQRHSCWSWFGRWYSGCSCMSCCCIPPQLALILVLTSAPCASGVFHQQQVCTNTPLAHVVVSTYCNLHWWRFSFQQLAQIIYLHLCNLHCVLVVACDGGICVLVYIYIYVYIYICIYIYIYNYKRVKKTFPTKNVIANGILRAQPRPTNAKNLASL